MMSSPSILARFRIGGSIAIRHHRRLSSAAGELIQTGIDEGNGVAILVLNRPPANSLSMEMNEEISRSIKNIDENYPKVQSVILASSNPAIFSAGLDVAELIAPDPDRLPQFWKSLQQVYIDLYGSRLATVACLTGHAPAAGCFLAMACDYRVMYAGGTVNGRKHMPKIGLNETQLGIAAPPWMGQLLVRTIGFRRAELALAMGTLFPPHTALEIGLVDEIVPSDTEESSSDDALQALLPGDKMKDQMMQQNAVLQQAFIQATRFAKVPPQARVASKMLTRSEHLEDMIAKRQHDTDHFCGFITQEEVQGNLREYVQQLKTKSKQK
jgi:3,2-trans-enoyl-CoA isomerase